MVPIVAAPTIDTYHEPTTLAEAAQSLPEGPATLVAGGTIVMREAQAGRFAYAPTLINLHRIGELRRMEVTADGVKLGSLVSLREINEHAGLRDDAPILIHTTRHMACAQIRNLGTIGGNLCWASPSADLALAFLLLDASVELVSWSDGDLAARTLPIAEFLTGPEQTACEPNEVLAAINIPKPWLGLRAAFRKSGTRIALDTTIASVAAVAAVNDAVDGLGNVRLGSGGVAATAIRLPHTEALIEGQVLTEALIENAIATAREEMDPPGDARASAWYRRELVGSFTGRALQELAAAT